MVIGSLIDVPAAAFSLTPCRHHDYLVLQITDLKITNSILFISHRGEGTSVTFVCSALLSTPLLGSRVCLGPWQLSCWTRWTTQTTMHTTRKETTTTSRWVLQNFLRFLMALEYVLLFQLLCFFVFMGKVSRNPCWPAQCVDQANLECSEVLLLCRPPKCWGCWCGNLFSNLHLQFI